MTLFLSIMHKLSETSPYFCERYDTTGRAGLTALQKCITALRQLAYGIDTNTINYRPRVSRVLLFGHH
jgi:hypothetical protein